MKLRRHATYARLQMKMFLVGFQMSVHIKKLAKARREEGALCMGV
jgi:hypothetical protein